MPASGDLTHTVFPGAITADEITSRTQVFLKDRGAWDVTESYAVGNVARHDGVTYVATAPVLADARSDTFARPDQSGWGTATGGFVWADAGIGFATGAISVASGRGLQVGNTGGDGRFMRAGPALASANMEVLLRWTLLTAAPGTNSINLRLRSTLDTTVSQATLQLRLDGTWTHYVIHDPTNDSETGTWAGGASGQTFWTRYRIVGDQYSWRTWLDGASEPVAWDVTRTSAVATLQHYVLVTLGGDGATGDSLAIDHFVATTLQSAPADDPVHWAVLGGGGGSELVPGSPGTVRWEVMTDSGGNLLVDETGTVIETLMPN